MAFALHLTDRSQPRVQRDEQRRARREERALRRAILAFTRGR